MNEKNKQKRQDKKDDVYPLSNVTFVKTSMQPHFRSQFCIWNIPFGFFRILKVVICQFGIITIKCHI